MEARDTVMTSQQIKQLKADLGNHDMDAGYKPEHYDIRWGDKAIAERQAEITWNIAFKAGYEEAKIEMIDPNAGYLKDHNID